MTSALPAERQGIRYTILERADVPDVVRTLSRAFSRRDPPAVAVGLTAAEFEPLLAAGALGSLGDRLTVLARDAASGAVAGAVLAEDGSAPPPDLAGLAPGFEPIFDLFSHLEDSSTAGHTAIPGETLHIAMLGVDERFARRGIARELVRLCLANGRERGYRRAVAEATNLVSQHIFRSLGFVRRAQASYAEYRFHGEAPFASIAAEGGPMAVERLLAPTD